MADPRRTNAVETASTWSQGNIAGLDDAMTRRLVASTVYTESNGGDLAITNTQGYTGRYQAGAQWLADAGLVDGAKVQAAMREAGYTREWDWAVSGGMTRFLQDASNWNDGLSLDQYKASAALQDGAFKTVSDQAYQQALRLGVINEGDSQEHIAGILKARHIAGMGGAQRIMQGSVVADTNGTSNADYYNDIAINQDRLDTMMGMEAGRDRSVLVRGALEDGILQSGERGEGVRQLQEALNAEGFSAGTADGRFGNNTEQALRAYQQANALPVNGIADAALIERLGIGQNIHTMPDQALRDGMLERGEKGPSVRELQTALIGHGHELRVDGDFGPGTENAVRRYQEANGMAVTGQADRDTLQALGLGALLQQDTRAATPVAPTPAEITGGSVTPPAAAAAAAEPAAAAATAPAAQEGMTLTRAFELTQQFDHVRYGFGDKHPERGTVDCSGWVVRLANSTMDEINEKAGRTVFERSERYSPGYDSAAGILEKTIERSGVRIEGRDITRDVLREGMVIGEDNGDKRWDRGRFEGIDHVTMVVRDPTDGELKISQSRSGAGVDLMDLDRYLEQKHARGTRLFASDPFAHARDLLREHDPAAVQPAGAAAAPSVAAAQDTQVQAAGASGYLRHNSRGAQVELLQQQLNQLGHTDNAGRALDADAIFGPRTDEAVRSFQRANGLAVDGIVGPDTYAALDKAMDTARTSGAAAIDSDSARCAPQPDTREQGSFLSSLLDAARNRDPEALREAVSSLADTPVGRAFAQARDAAQEQVAQREADAQRNEGAARQ